MEHLASYWVRCPEFQVVEKDGIQYFTAPKASHKMLYDVRECGDALLVDALNVGKGLTENLAEYPDALRFIRKYGLLGILTEITTGMDCDQYDMVVVHANIFTKSRVEDIAELSRIFFPFDDVNLYAPLPLEQLPPERWPIFDKMLMSDLQYAEQVEWVEHYFKYLYSFMDAEGQALAKFNKANFSAQVNPMSDNLLDFSFNSLKAMIDLAFIQAKTDSRKPLRRCKFCGKIFYAKDIRSDFCSPKCRNKFNVYKFRAKQ